MSPTWIGVSLKMYFGHARTRAWCTRVREVASVDPGFRAGLSELVVLPGFVSLPTAVDVLAGSGVRIGAQDLATEDDGAFTGEVSGVELSEIGCHYAEVGHAERRTLFAENDDTIAAKTTAALRNRLVPVLCVGEPHRSDPAEAARRCVAEVTSALAPATSQGLLVPLVVAYEPHWAIGQAEPADPAYVATVCETIRTELEATGASARIVYGGSAGPGLLTQLGRSVDGLFLGRFAHDPEALRSVLAEASQVAQTTS